MDEYRYGGPERRAEPRFVPGRDGGAIGWYEGGQFRVLTATIQSLSTRGAALLVEGRVPPVKRAWVCLIGPSRPGWVGARVVEQAPTADGPLLIRLAFDEALPYDLFTALVWGAPDRGAPQGEEVGVGGAGPPPRGPTAGPGGRRPNPGAW